MGKSTCQCPRQAARNCLHLQLEGIWRWDSEGTHMAADTRAQTQHRNRNKHISLKFEEMEEEGRGGRQMKNVFWNVRKGMSKRGSGGASPPHTHPHLPHTHTLTPYTHTSRYWAMSSSMGQQVHSQPSPDSEVRSPPRGHRPPLVVTR